MSPDSSIPSGILKSRYISRASSMLDGICAGIGSVAMAGNRAAVGSGACAAMCFWAVTYFSPVSAAYARAFFFIAVFSRMSS